MVVPRWPQSYQSGGQHEGYLFSLANCSAVNSSVISPKLRRIIISKMLRSSSVLGAAGAARELDHGLVAVEERQARQLAPVAVTVEETNVPAFAIGKRHKDAVLSPAQGRANSNLLKSTLRELQFLQLSSYDTHTPAPFRSRRGHPTGTAKRA